jgi:hypothetical protein
MIDPRVLEDAVSDLEAKYEIEIHKWGPFTNGSVVLVIETACGVWKAIRIEEGDTYGEVINKVVSSLKGGISDVL